MARGKPVATVRSRRLAVYLQQARRAAGMTFTQAALAADLDEVTIRRAENPATCRPRPNNVKAMLAAYGVTDPAEVRRAVEAAKDAARPGWWDGYELSPEHAAFIDAEAAARDKLVWEPSLIPGLLQTASYARAVIASGPQELTPVRVEELVRLRMERQKLLLREDPLRLSVIIDEAALRRVVGTADLMRDQLWSLAQAASEGPAVVRVLADGAGAHPAMVGPFTILRYADPADPDVLYEERLGGASYAEDEAALERAHRAFSHLESKALSRRATMDLAARLAAGL